MSICPDCSGTGARGGYSMHDGPDDLCPTCDGGERVSDDSPTRAEMEAELAAEYERDESLDLGATREMAERVRQHYRTVDLLWGAGFADTVLALCDEVERLTKERDDWYRGWQGANEGLLRYEAALREIAEFTKCQPPGYDAGCGACRIARNALSQEKG